jgi:hypothetical protein
MLRIRGSQEPIDGNAAKHVVRGHQGLVTFEYPNDTGGPTCFHI